MNMQKMVGAWAMFLLAAVSNCGATIAAEQDSQDQGVATDTPAASNQEPATPAKPAKKAGKKLHGERRSSTRPLRLPQGPVRIVHLEGTDILIIIGKNTSRRPKPASTVPSGDSRGDQKDRAKTRS